MLSGCMAFADTWQVYNLAKIESALDINLKKPGKLVYSEPAYDYFALPAGEKRYKSLQYAFCQDVFYLWNQNPRHPEL